MKKELISLVLGLAVISCDSIIEDTSPTGTTIVVKNNTFGVRDFDIASFKKYPIAFGSFDYGRNFGGNNYQDSIGYIEFRTDQTGTIHFYNQDTIQIKGEFQFGFFRFNEQWRLFNCRRSVHLKSGLRRVQRACRNSKYSYW